MTARATPIVCPRCQEPMGLPMRGRKTGTWIRTCGWCFTQLLSTEAPDPPDRSQEAPGQPRAMVPVTVELPFFDRDEWTRFTAAFAERYRQPRVVDPEPGP